MSAFPAPHAATDAVLVGLSGGLDSSVLLHWLASAPLQRTHGLAAVHVHHGLHPQADAWQAHCEALCARLRVPLQVARVEVARDGGLGLEGAAREARHAAFAAALLPGQRLALAHHQDDQAETFLLRALRGSGPAGLGAMRAQRPFAAGHLWRPLLDVPREALLAYARQHALAWIDDPSNADDHHDRNFLRLRVLPLLRARWPHAAAALARSAALSAATDALLVADDANVLEQALSADGGLPLSALAALPAPRRARLLRRWVDQRGLPPLPARAIAMVEAELRQPAADRAACFAWHATELRRWRQQLYLRRPTPPWPRDWQADWDGLAPLPLPDGGSFALLGTAPRRFATPLQVRLRRGGERIALPGRAHSHQLKHLLQQAGVPPWQRLTLPLLVDGGQVLAAGDLFVAAPLRQWLDAAALRLCWRTPRSD